MHDIELKAKSGMYILSIITVLLDCVKSIVWAIDI